MIIVTYLILCHPRTLRLFPIKSATWMVVHEEEETCEECASLQVLSSTVWCADSGIIASQRYSLYHYLSKSLEERSGDVPPLESGQRPLHAGNVSDMVPMRAPVSCMRHGELCLAF
jgi:hypothetical protein